MKRQQILSLVRQKHEVSLTALREQVPTAPRLVTLMKQDGLVTVTQRRVLRDPFGDPVDPDIPPGLTREQAEAVNTVRKNLDHGFVPYLLSGVTGSGKTEVYLRLVADATDRGQSAIVLVPEIALISQTERRFRARFGEQIAVIHSMLSQGERLDQWHRIATGKVSIAIGARSAISRRLTISASSSWTKSMTAPTNRKTACVTTPGIWPWCVPECVPAQCCWDLPPRRFRPLTTCTSAGFISWISITGSMTAPCRRSPWWT